MKTGEQDGLAYDIMRTRILLGNLGRVRCSFLFDSYWDKECIIRWFAIFYVYRRERTHRLVCSCSTVVEVVAKVMISKKITRVAQVVGPARGMEASVQEQGCSRNPSGSQKPSQCNAEHTCSGPGWLPGSGSSRPSTSEELQRGSSGCNRAIQPRSPPGSPISGMARS